MTKLNELLNIEEEQEKAINNLKQYIKEDEIYNSARENLSDFDKFCINHCTDIEIALDLIKIQQKKIEDNEYRLRQEIKCNRENISEIMQKNQELAKKDKVIELMTDAMAKNHCSIIDIVQEYICNNRCVGNNDWNCKKCIKQYFEKKVENKYGY